MPFATTWVDLEDIMASEINQMEKDKYCMIPLIFGESTKPNKTENQAHRYKNRSVVSRGEGCGRVGQNKRKGPKGTNLQL